jgi:hypothetical protein
MSAQEGEKLSEEIYRQEGDNFRSVMITLEADGTLQIDAQDMGPLVKEVWGDSDYEFWCRIPPEAASKLAYALLRKHYTGREQAVDEVRTLCAEAGVPCENGSYA